MRVLKVQMKECLNQIEFKVCFAFWCLISFGGIVISCMKYYDCNYLNIRSAADSFLLVSPNASAVAQIFTLTFPLIAAVMCAGTRRNGEKSGGGLFSMTRMSRKQYVFGNALVTVLLTGASILFTLLVNQLLCLIVFPVEGYSNRFGVAEYLAPLNYDSNALLDFWQVQNPYLYNLIYMVLISVLGAGIGFVCYAVQLQKIFQRYRTLYISIGIFLLFIGLSIMGQILDMPLLSFLSYVEVGHYVRISDYILFVILIYGAGTILTIRGAYQYEYI